MPRHNEYDLICIGSGPAGQRAAIQAAKLGKKVAVIEKQQCIGGVCIETGTIPSKTFREAVRRLYTQPSLDRTDTDVYVPHMRPTMPQLISHVGRVMQREMQIIRDALTRNDVELVHGLASLRSPMWYGSRPCMAIGSSPPSTFCWRSAPVRVNPRVLSLMGKPSSPQTIS